MKATYLPHLVSGHWLATMCLTEPQAGSDLGLLRAQFNLRIQKSTGQLNQTHTIKQVRRDIARVKTVLNEKAGA